MNCLRRLLPPLSLGVLCAAWMLYPAWLAPEHVLVGDWRHPDTLSNHWLYAWVALWVMPPGSRATGEMR